MLENKHKIVVVDDDPGMKQAMERLLNAAGFCVESFASAEALLQSGKAETATCLILDVHLPGLSGFDLNQRLRQTGCRTPVVFITAYDEADSRTRAQTDFALGYFVKPFPGQSLLSAISRAIQIGNLPQNP
jgi:FixJ family two-component response regulator